MRFYGTKPGPLCRCVLAALVVCTLLLSRGADAQSRLFIWGDNTNQKLGLKPSTWAYGNSTWYGRGAPAHIHGVSNVVTIAAGYFHTLVLKSDGTVWAWGFNSYGQLGDGAYCVGSDRPVQVVGLSNVIAIAAGGNHSLALKSDGTVWAWGENGNGELGIGTNDTNLHPIPVQVTALTTRVTAIGAGDFHNMVLKADGTVWLWGYNYNGQVGDNTTTDRYSPVRITQFSNVTAISAGALSSMAQTRSGAVWIWGYPYDKVPAQVPGLTGVTSMATGFAYSLALKSDHTLWSISATSGLQASQVSGISNVTSITIGGQFVTVALANGTVWSVGNDFGGDLGDGTTNNTSNWNFVQAIGIGDAVQVQAGQITGMALGSDGRVWGWGDNTHGELAARSPANQARPVPNRFALGSIRSAAGGDSYFLVARKDGTVWSWGNNYYGELGNGDSGGLADHYDAPVQVVNLTGAVQVAASRSGTNSAASYALKSDGSAWAWGHNNYGQLGNNTTTDSDIPIQVTGLASATAISAGSYHALALKNDGSVWSWGSNVAGQLGDGTVTQRLTPVQVSNLANVIAIAAGDQFSLALKSDGTVWAWGDNTDGQLGNGSTTQQNSPMQVTGLTNIVAIAAGFEHVLALRNDGAVFAWGSNLHGELGNGTTTRNLTPQQLSGMTNVSAISAGGDGNGGVSFAIKSDHTVWAWGYDNDGQLGDGILTASNNQLTPSQVILPGVTRIVSAGTVTLGLVKDIEPDFNADGNSDLILQNNATGQHQVWYLNGATYSGANANLAGAIPTAWILAGTADLNGNGNSDLIWHNTMNGSAVYMLLNGVTPLSVGPVTRSMPAQWKIVGIADLNGDGNSDLIWQNTTTGAVNFMLLNGVIPVAAGVIVHSMPLQWKVVGTADMNGDGYPDLIWQNTATGDVMVWYMNKTVYTGNSDILATGIPLSQHLASIQDLVGDNQPDLIWQTDAGDAIFWQMDDAVGWTGMWNYISQGIASQWSIVRAH